MRNNKEGHIMTSHDVQHDLNEEWNQAMETMSLVRLAGGFSNFAKEHIKEVSGFLHEPDHVCCIDERIPHDGAVSIAGSGLLIKDDIQVLDDFVESLKINNIKRVFIHENCGAVGLYAKSKNISIEDANKDALEWAQKLTKLLGGNEVQKILPVDINFHNAQCTYIMSSNVSGMKKPFPRGFEISSYVSLPQILKQVEVSIDIALTGHGFGILFTKENPFIVVVVAKNDDDLSTMKKNTNLIKLVSKYNGRVIIDGFVTQHMQ